MQELQETQVPSLGREDPLEEEMATHSSILAGKSHGQRSLAGYSPWGHKESDMAEQLTLSLFFFLIPDTVRGSILTLRSLHYIKQNKTKWFCISIQYIISVATNINKSVKGHIRWLLSNLGVQEGISGDSEIYANYAATKHIPKDSILRQKYMQITEKC